MEMAVRERESGEYGEMAVRETMVRAVCGGVGGEEVRRYGGLSYY